MYDTQKIKKLADIISNHSLNIIPKDKVIIEAPDNIALEFAYEIYKNIVNIGAEVSIEYDIRNFPRNKFKRYFLNKAPIKLLSKKPSLLEKKINWANKFIHLVSEPNSSELSNVNKENQKIFLNSIRELQNIRVKKDWVLLFLPTDSMAQSANISTEELTNIFFDSILLDYKSLNSYISKYKKILDNVNTVTLKGYKTDLKISIKNRTGKICSGSANLPDGELYFGPIETETSGEIYFDMPSIYLGHKFNFIYLEFLNGKVVNAKSDNQTELDYILSIDNGANILGELGIGFNEKITKPMLSTIFDEKIFGTIHLALGQSYDSASVDGGGVNKSKIHWDIVKDMRKKGSKIYADDKLIFKDGKYII